MSNASGPISDLHAIRRRFGRYYLTNNGTLIGAISLTGRDPDGLSVDDHEGMSIIAQKINMAVPPSISILQCYSHYDGAQVKLRTREHPISEQLSRARETAINGKNIATSNLVHFFEIAPRDNLNELNPKGFLKHGFRSFFNEDSRAVFFNYLSDQGVLYVQREELQRQAVALDDALEQVAAKWSGLMVANVLTASQTWAHLRFLATFDPRYFIDGLHEKVPDSDLDLCVVDGDIEPKLVGPMDVLKLGGCRPRYARIASLTKLGKPNPGLWGRGDGAPIRTRGNYVILTRWTPLTEFKRTTLFKKKETEIERKSLDIWSVMQGADKDTSFVEKKARMKPQVKAKLDELAEAEKLDEKWGIAHSFMAVFNDDAAKLRNTSIDLERAVSQQGLSITWESVDLPHAYATLQPGGKERSIRDLTFTSAQLGASSLVYRGSSGQLIVPDLDGEEPHYILQTDSNEFFAYSDFIGGRSFVVGVGPTRSGKTYFKNTLTTHFLKYGGMVYCADIDPGSETIAMLFGDDGGIFRVGHESTRGFNPFALAAGPDDRAFIAHARRLLIQQLAANDDPAMQHLDPLEQDHLDAAIVRTLKLPPEMRRWGTLVAHMPHALAKKFGRWIYGVEGADEGVYAPLFDSPTDSIGRLDKKVSVFNMQALIDDPNAIKTCYMELFYRATKVFEDPAYRSLPKRFEVDEAKYPLSIPDAREFFTSKVRRWGKFNAGITLWTQSPEDYLSVDGWDAIRTAATTFIFLADPQMDAALYKKTFNLTDGECEAIRGLQPRHDAYIVQREIGVSKRVILEAEPIQDVANTSHPREATIRDQLIQEHGFKRGLELAIPRIHEFRDREFTQEVHTVGG